MYIVADYSVQSIIVKILSRDGRHPLHMIAEEDSKELEKSDLSEQVKRWVSVGLGEDNTKAMLLDDLSKDVNTSDGYWWTLDPIDGTKGIIFISK